MRYIPIQVNVPVCETAEEVTVMLSDDPKLLSEVSKMLMKVIAQRIIKDTLKHQVSVSEDQLQNPSPRRRG